MIRPPPPGKWSVSAGEGADVHQLWGAQPRDGGQSAGAVRGAREEQPAELGPAGGQPHTVSHQHRSAADTRVMTEKQRGRIDVESFLLLNFFPSISLVVVAFRHRICNHHHHDTQLLHHSYNGCISSCGLCGTCVCTGSLRSSGISNAYCYVKGSI